jgi:glycosyltransferase involved in cell wall biosynthesis
VAIEAPFTALYRTDEQAEILAREIPSAPVLHWDHVGGDPGLRAPGVWYLATQLMLHPVSLDPIPSVITDARLCVAAVMYDVIPYRHPERYLVDANASVLARIRAPLARTTDAMLAISAFSADTAAEELLYPRRRMVVIGSGVDPTFAPAQDRPVGLAERFASLADVGCVVAVTGADDRKNTEGLIRAWSLVDASVRRHRRLVIATGVPAGVEQRWYAVAREAGIDDEVFITGSVSDDEMVALLQHAELSVMPSLEEGFGLPVVEAAACGCPVICSDRSSLPEVLDEPAATFDPTDPAAMAAAIDRALRDEDHRRVLGDAADRAVRRWTWANAAQRAVNALEELGPRWSMSHRTVED